MLGTQHYQARLFTYTDFESLIPKKHFLRRIDKIIDLSFVRELTRELYSSTQGRPSIDPVLFIRMVLIGYFYNIQSDRQLCEEIQYNLAYRWFCRLSLEDKVADHSSMTRIRDRFGEEIFEKIFRHIVDVCRKNNLVQGDSIMMDGTLIRANASKWNMIERKDKSDNDDDQPPKVIRNGKVTNKTHVSQSDPDSTLAGVGNVHKDLSYKSHHTIDTASRVIVDCKVTTGGVHESTMFQAQLERAEKLGLPIKELIADGGYGSGENQAHLENKEITAFVPPFNSRCGTAQGATDKNFIYEREKDRYLCPQGHYLYPYGKLTNSTMKLYRLVGGHCKTCPIKEECLPGKRPQRLLNRNIHQEIFDKVRERIKTDPTFKEKLWMRMWKMEGIFAEAKQNHGLRRAKYRGLSKVQIQVYMISAVQNLKRLLEASILNPGFGRLLWKVFFGNCRPVDFIQIFCQVG